MAGLSKGMSVKDIANKHKINIDALKKELKKGIKVEKEHTSDVKKATRIAMDHLFEDPKYYTKLEISTTIPTSENTAAVTLSDIGFLFGSLRYA